MLTDGTPGSESDEPGDVGAAHGGNDGLHRVLQGGDRREEGDFCSQAGEDGIAAVQVRAERLAGENIYLLDLE